MATSRKQIARKRASALSLVGLFAGIYAYSELAQTHWRSGFGAALLTLGCILCLLAFVARGRCEAPNADGRSFCQNRIYGLVFGCHLHTFERPLYMVGKGRKRTANPPLPPFGRSRMRQPKHYAASESVAIPVSTLDERERRRSSILFYVALVSLTTGSLSTFTDIFGFIKDVT